MKSQSKAEQFLRCVHGDEMFLHIAASLGIKLQILLSLVESSEQ